MKLAPMKFTVSALLAAFLLAPFADASRVGPEPYRRPHVPLRWEQRRVITHLIHRGRPVFCGSGRGNAVALTFDDGPGPYTEQIDGLLRASGAHATFFLIGNRLPYWPAAARADASLGAVGNHTWSHPHLPLLPRRAVWRQLAWTQSLIKGTTGSKPRIFRAPYEQRSPMTDAVARSLGLLQVLWSVDSGDDAKNAQVRQVVRTVVAGLQPGAIILLHDIHPWTVRALPQILAAIRLRGLRAVTVPELLALQPPAAVQHCPYPEILPRR
jgi:peptidoglycan/xylan/chitin deacetylase (PgdA/CDA1 family)